MGINRWGLRNVRLSDGMIVHLALTRSGSREETGPIGQFGNPGSPGLLSLSCLGSLFCRSGFLKAGHFCTDRLSMGKWGWVAVQEDCPAARMCRGVTRLPGAEGKAWGVGSVPCMPEIIF